ncbi:alpha/beta fold hydrolase [Nocardioides mesophilus]|uniref:Alpha/beta fold hydrolase n=1 Tax=Nocardioides mesophilus TaxID=433659 RepID=A0A7G9R7D6_9ACTN|nr:alpha/beta fold hydrolase [Nocardioides mesophilus]QNN51511.1 alpha/beta fold hydrolase [Nocardioides mesophilus]
MAPTRLIPSTGLSIAVREHTPPGPDRATVVLVHGYPDQQEMWDPLVDRLERASGGSLHLVTYDVRGAGASGVPEATRDYRTELLVDDLCAVLDAVLPAGGRAHLVGHDWGSVQLWDAVTTEATDPRLHGRIASFTSISGPSLDHTAWLARHPRGRRLRLLRQALHSTYVAAFQVPVLPDLAWRHLHPAIGRLVAAQERLGGGHWGPELGRNAAHGLGLYRANVPIRPTATEARKRGRELPHTDVPVLVIRPVHDHYLTALILEDLDLICGEVRVQEVDGGHWVARTDPDTVAAHVLEHVRAHP